MGCWAWGYVLGADVGEEDHRQGLQPCVLLVVRASHFGMAWGEMAEWYDMSALLPEGSASVCGALR